MTEQVGQCKRLNSQLFSHDGSSGNESVEQRNLRATNEDKQKKTQPKLGLVVYTVGGKQPLPISGRTQSRQQTRVQRKRFINFSR